MDIRQALFFNDSRSVLKFPVSIINVLHTDEVGQIWFIVNRPAQHLNEFEKEFRARLNFYKKGKNYFLHIKGKACIVSDPEEINNVHGLEEDIKILSSSTMALIRMKIEKIYYYPAKKQAPEVEPVIPKLNVHSLAVVKRLQYIIKDIIPVFQSH
ncbi:MAG TPA: pyridoxamine 5'-phosphate oxidase family protein [Flavitalea sp.]|nr:pyridoxamine 5'-phosphate oxidase family protein [Flavitalea sp.]